MYIEGKLETRKWTGQDGNDRYTTEIIAREMQILGRREEGEGGGGYGGGGGGYGGGQQSGGGNFDPQPMAGDSGPDEDDDLPF